jgi:hypothetical protein
LDCHQITATTLVVVACCEFGLVWFGLNDDGDDETFENSYFCSILGAKTQKCLETTRGFFGVQCRQRYQIMSGSKPLLIGDGQAATKQLSVSAVSEHAFVARLEWVFFCVP